MKLNREARWLIILTLMALLVVGGAGAVSLLCWTANFIVGHQS